MLSIIYAILVLGILIFVHELGHFLVAKKFNILVEKFSLGFGPKLIGKKIGETEYLISAVPLGGYVKMYGENPSEETEISEDKKERAFSTQPIYKKMLVVFAGPFFNALLAVIIFFSLYLSGIPQLLPKVGKVSEGFPAYSAGVKTGDMVISIDEVKINSWEELSEAIQKSKKETITLIILRDGKEINLSITPNKTVAKNIFGETVERKIIGISDAREVITVKFGIFESAKRSILQTYKLTELTLLSIVKLIERVLPLNTLGGPLMIVQMAGEQAKEGVSNLAFFTALLSINLFVLNLLPIPVLDGGHIFFYLIEGIIRKPISVKFKEIAQQVGFALLIILMVFVIYNDIVRMVGK